ncbi:hypothetical protein [Streptomyces sp. ODS28]|uniref:hypothetical protein n=1 Tax=Streptomyces sp. ODS28 TaxID=3136688 RepID=UPI0031EA0DDE
MTSGGFRALEEQATVDVRGIYSVPDEPAGEETEGTRPEAVVFVLADGRSVTLTSTADGTLSAALGGARTMPDWCVPAEDWTRRRLPGLPENESPGRTSGVVEITGERGARVGVLLAFESVVLEVRAGEPLTVAVRKSR